MGSMGKLSSQLEHVSRVFFIARGLYTGMEATPKAPQGHHLWKRRLRAPTRDTFKSISLQLGLISLQLGPLCTLPIPCLWTTFVEMMVQLYTGSFMYFADSMFMDNVCGNDGSAIQWDGVRFYTLSLYIEHCVGPCLLGVPRKTSVNDHKKKLLKSVTLNVFGPPKDFSQWPQKKSD